MTRKAGPKPRPAASPMIAPGGRHRPGAGAAIFDRRRSPPGGRVTTVQVIVTRCWEGGLAGDRLGPLGTGRKAGR